MKVSVVTAYNNLAAMTVEFLDNMMEFWPRTIIPHVVLVNGGCPIKISHRFISKRIDLKENRGFCLTLNEGLKEVAPDSDYIFFVGNDSFPTSSNWLLNLIELKERTGAWMVCPANDNPGMKIHWAKYTRSLEDHWEADFYPSIAWLMPQDKFHRIGFLDNRFTGTGMYADNDYCMRIRQQNGLIVVSKNILLRHLCSAEGKVLGTQSRDMDVCKKIYEEKWGVKML